MQTGFQYALSTSSMSNVVHQGALFHRGESDEWKEYSGQLLETGELRLMALDGALFKSISIVKGTPVPGPFINNIVFYPSDNDISKYFVIFSELLRIPHDLTSASVLSFHF